MRFTINSKAIKKDLGEMKKITMGKTHLVTSNFKIEAEGDFVYFTATDLTTTICAKFPAIVVEEGSLLVNAKRFCEMLTSEKIEVWTDKSHIHVNHFSMRYYDGAWELESFPTGIMQGYCQAKRESLAKMMRHAIQFTAKNDRQIQSAIAGVYLKAERGILTIAATDTKSISETKCKLIVSEIKDTDASGHDVEWIEAILPSQACAFLSTRTLGDYYHVSFSKSRVGNRYMEFVSSDSAIRVTCSLLEGRYPFYLKALDKEPEQFMIIPTLEFKNVIKEALVFCDDDDCLMRLTFTGRNLKIESLISESGSASLEINNIGYQGEKWSCAINAKLLLRVLGLISTSYVKFGSRSNLEPIRMLNHELSNCVDIRFVVMPMRISNARDEISEADKIILAAKQAKEVSNGQDDQETA